VTEDLKRENEDLLLYQLLSEFHQANKKIVHHLDRELMVPNFALICGSHPWGAWNSDKRCLKISVDLLHHFEWEAVVHVLRHEMAHMIVREIWHEEGKAHGEAFKKACKVLDIDSRSCASPDFLSGFKGVGNESSVVNKIRKLMLKGQCGAATEAEAEAFIKKAQQLMSAHNLSNFDVLGADKVFVRRPVGGKHKRFPTWLWTLADLVSEHYGVQNIRAYTRDYDGVVYSYLELFGEPSCVDVAEYVFHVVMVRAEALYENHKRDGNRKRDRKRKLSKPAFMKGLVAGYRSTLDESKHEMEKSYTDKQRSLVLANDKLLQEKYNEAYPQMKMVTHASKGAGFKEGQEAGEGLVVAPSIGADSFCLIGG
jgi:hypothetical protein